jgi:hypothetical protein
MSCPWPGRGKREPTVGLAPRQLSDGVRLALGLDLQALCVDLGLAALLLGLLHFGLGQWPPHPLLCGIDLYVSLGDAVIERYERVEFLVVDSIRVQMILLHALGIGNTSKPLTKGMWKCRPGNGTELAEAGNGGALVLADGEERRNKAPTKPRAPSGILPLGPACCGVVTWVIGTLLTVCEESPRQPLARAELASSIAVMVGGGGREPRLSATR